VNGEELRTRVAELCGWTKVDPPDKRHNSYVMHPPGTQEYVRVCPDYPNDLDAICEAVSNAPTEDDAFEFRYMSNLQKVVQSDHDEEIGGFELAHATASQRAEAFVNTMGAKP